MNYELYPCQVAAVNHAVRFLLTAKPGNRQAYKGPTGVGKSIIELKVQEATGAVIVTPRVEIANAMVVKLGRPNTNPESLGIWTPIRLRNKLMAGHVQPPSSIIWDELHHHESDSWSSIDLLCGLVPSVGFTATYFRGTPKGTRSFHEHWGEPVTIATWGEAAALGYIRLPSFEVLPLVDDDVVDVSNGEFSVTSLEAHTVDRLGDLVAHARSWHDGQRWRMATLFAVPSTAIAIRLASSLSAASLPTVMVNKDTVDRASLFRAAEECLVALVHINVISEGVDLRLRRLVDLAPTLSPVRWLQQLGRITRPWDRQPEYVCCNRNIVRHAYAMEGALPSSVVAEAEKAFPQTSRAHVRVMGLESIGRFKPSSARLRGGASVYVYSLFAVVDNFVAEFACLVPPTGEPVWACKTRAKLGVGEEATTHDWGTWVKTDQPQDLTGFQSKAPSSLTDKQKAWWKRSAHQHGLDPHVEVDAKAFQVLPILKDLGLRLT